MALALGVESPILLQALLQGISDEMFLLDGALEIVEVSASVYHNTGCDLAALRRLSLDSMLGVSADSLRRHVAAYRQPMFTELVQEQAPLTGNTSHNHLRVMPLVLGGREHILIIKNDSASREAAIQALRESESRFQAIVSNTPGLVFQFQLDKNGEISFVYLSDGCMALLGLTSDELKRDPGLFYSMMNARDRTTLRKRVERSTKELSLLNWEGRVWIDDWQDTKWVNLRSIPRLLDNGSVQWEGIMTNITQSKNEKFEIEQSRRSLAELSAHMNHIKEEERSRIAREIHDDLGGNLTVIKIGLASIIKRVEAEQPVKLEQAKNLEAIVDNTFEAVHRISGDLRPNILELGIVAALEWQSKEFAKQIDVPCDFECNRAELQVTEEQAITLFRICQESMSNIAKHAHASRVGVSLLVEDQAILLQIVDDGVGIKSGDALKSNSFGLRGMQERVAALQGSFSIAQREGRGTRMAIRLPVQAGQNLLT